MESAVLSTNDLIQHTVTFGMDIYPPVELQNERTRLNMFYEEARAGWPNLFDQLVTSESEFRISMKFRKRREVEGQAISSDTFVLTNRGPVFVFPLRLPDPVGDTGIEASLREDFTQLRKMFFSAFAPRVVMRLGLVRDLVFATGRTKCHELIADQVCFANAALVGGQTTVTFRDSKHNHLIMVEPVSLARTTQLAVGPPVREDAGYGLHVRFDINNFDMQQPLQEADIQAVLDRATSLWPDELLEYLHNLPRRKQP